ncbi:MAG: response regulator [bacterium]|nr:response regulator [bacterium]MDT8365220.1 response regulator [bacterium]
MAVKVLIVDDAMFMRNMIAEIFNGKKYKEEDYQVVAEAENGIEAVDKYKEHDPDIVTMDIVMPEMTGIEALKEIMGLDPGANVIMCSALGQDSLVMEALDAGAKDFIVKPFQPEKVLDVVTRILDETRGR